MIKKQKDSRLLNKLCWYFVSNTKGILQLYTTKIFRGEYTAVALTSSKADYLTHAYQIIRSTAWKILCYLILILKQIRITSQNGKELLLSASITQ